MRDHGAEILPLDDLRRTDSQVADPLQLPGLVEGLALLLDERGGDGQGCPARSIPISTGPAPLARMARVADSQSATGFPATETMTSPGRRPARAAGLAWSAEVQVGFFAYSAAVFTQSGTAETSVLSTPTPKPMSTTANRTKASTKFIAGPPNMMTTFCHQGLR
nr:hypothetical protein GCM10020093_048040 [Planobispora longispora]